MSKYILGSHDTSLREMNKSLVLTVFAASKRFMKSLRCLQCFRNHSLQRHKIVFKWLRIIVRQLCSINTNE